MGGEGGSDELSVRERERDISERFYFCINKSVREKKNARIEIAKCIDDNNNNNDRIKNGDEKLEKRNGGGGEGRVIN